MTFDPSRAFIDCPKCDSAHHVERVKGEQWFCNCCSHSFAVPSPALEAGSPAGRVARREAHQPTAALQFITAVALVALLPALGNAQGRVFYEPGDGSSGATTDCRVTTSSRDGVPHRNGSALECGWDGTLGWQDSAKTRELELASVPMKSERLISAWFRVDANVDAKAGSKLMRVGYGSANEIIVSCQFENSPATLWMGVNAHASYWGGVAAANCRDGWKRLRIYTSPSLVRVWLGDVLLREWTGTFAINSMATFMSQWSNNPGWEHDALNHVYWDELEIFTDAGNGGSGSMRDGTMTHGGVVTPPPPPPPAPVDCAGTWGAWSRVANSESACSATGTRTFSEARLFTVVTPASNGGAACPASPESRTVTENCMPPVQSVTYTCWVTSAPSGYADGDVRRYIRCDTNGPVTSLPTGTTFTVSVPRK